MNYELLNEIKNILNNDFDIITILKTLISSYEEAKELFISANDIDCKNNGDIFDYDVFINLLQHSFSKDYLYYKEIETIIMWQKKYIHQKEFVVFQYIIMIYIQHLK